MIYHQQVRETSATYRYKEVHTSIRRYINGHSEVGLRKGIYSRDNCTARGTIPKKQEYKKETISAYRVCEYIVYKTYC